MTAENPLEETIRRISEDVEVVRQAISDIQQDLRWAVNQLGPYLEERQWTAEKKEFCLQCTSCDVDSPDSLDTALSEGWTQLQKDETESWTHLGKCPACIGEELARDFERMQAETGKTAPSGSEPRSQAELF